MSSSLSTMPFSRQYGSFRVTSTTGGGGNGGSATGSGTSSNTASGAPNRHARHSSGNESTGLPMAPLVHRTVGNLARNVSNNWLNNSSRNQNTRTATFAPLHQQKHTHYHHHAPAAAPQQDQQEVGVVRCTVHRAGPVKQQQHLGQPIADTPLLQSPRIIARSTAARLVEPNAWNRRLTTSNFCALSSGAATATSSRLLCRKSPGSSGTSVESIVPKYSRPAATTTPTTMATSANTGAAQAESTTAQKRTYNAHKSQLRVTNASGRIGTVAKKLTGGSATVHSPANTSSSSAAQNAEREVAMVLHHHNMRVIDMFNNNHLQQQQQQQQTSRAAARAVKENNENYQPGQKQLPGLVAKKGPSGIPQRLPLADRDQPTTERNKRLLLGGGSTAECSFSSKFPNGLPFEQEFYYRRPPEVGDGHALSAVMSGDKAEDESDEQQKLLHHHHHHQQRIRNGTKKNVLLPRRGGGGGGGRGVEQVPPVPHRSRSVSVGEMNETSPGPPDAQDQRRSVSAAADRLPDDEDALYVDFTKRCEPERADKDGGAVVPPPSLVQTSVVEYRNINHSSYYYKFESVSQRTGRSRYQRARLGLNRPEEPPGTMATDVNGNGVVGRREYYDDDDDDDDGEGDERFNEDHEPGELEEEDGERSTVYVAVATWVPKCNRLPNETTEHNNNSICLTLAADKAAQRHPHPRPTRIAVAAAPTTTPPPTQLGRTTQHAATKTATAAPSSYGQL